MILVSNPENLLKVPGLDPAKPTQELLTDYLKKNGVDLQPPTRAILDEKSGSLQVMETFFGLCR